MRITAEELARDKADAEKDAALWAGHMMAEYPKVILKYIAEVERLQALLDAKIDGLPFGALIRHFSGTEAEKMYELDRANQALRTLFDDDDIYFVNRQIAHQTTDYDEWLRFMTGIRDKMRATKNDSGLSGKEEK